VSFLEIDLYLRMSKEKEWEREEVSSHMSEENPSPCSKFIKNIYLMISRRIKRILFALKQNTIL